METGEEVSCCLFVAGGDGAELLDGIEEALGEIALGIECEIAGTLDLAIGFWRDDGFDGPHFESRDEAAAVISLVGDHGLRLDLGGQFFSLRDIVSLSAGQTDRERIAQGIDDGVDFRRQSAARAADGLIFAPFLSAPALC